MTVISSFDEANGMFAPIQELKSACLCSESEESAAACHCYSMHKSSLSAANYIRNVTP